MDDGVVEYILDFLKPWKAQLRQIEKGARAGEIEEKSPAEAKAAISETIRGEIARLRATVPDFFDREAIRKTRDDARGILASIDDLDKRLSAKTLSPELRLRLGADNSSDGSPADLTNAPISRLIEALGIVREICQAADYNQPRGDQVKEWCARRALWLVLNYSESNPTAGSDKTNYCAIARLLYQSVTGREQSLRGVCQDVLRPYLAILP